MDANRQAIDRHGAALFLRGMADTTHPFDPAFDLDAYLGRVGYPGPREPTLAVLKTLHALHPQAIPFENLTPLMGDPVPLALAALQAKLVGGRRGGYCFELNGLFKAALDALGFAVTPLAARVLWGAADGAPERPPSHMLLRLDLPEGPYIADVGFGGAVMTAPLRLQPDIIQSTPHEPYRLLSHGAADYELQILFGAAWRPLYRFDLTPRTPDHYERMNAFTSTDPSSPLVNGLMAARAGPRGRLALLDTRLTVRRPGQPPAERTLTALTELKAVLSEDFGLSLPDGVDRIGDKLGL